jgi:uncharacterized protein YgbK (DUF1537 family)
VTEPARTKPLYAYYGDDFTGSTDVLERLALEGVSAVLFTELPEEADLAAFAHCRAIGNLFAQTARGSSALECS